MRLSLQSLRSRTSPSMLRPFVAACLMILASFGWIEWAAAAACPLNDYQFKYQNNVDALGATGCDSKDDMAHKTCGIPDKAGANGGVVASVEVAAGVITATGTLEVDGATYTLTASDSVPVIWTEGGDCLTSGLC